MGTEERIESWKRKFMVDKMYWIKCSNCSKKEEYVDDATQLATILMLGGWKIVDVERVGQQVYCKECVAKHERGEINEYKCAGVI